MSEAVKLIEVNGKELSEFLGVDPSWVSKLKKEGSLRAAKSGKFNLFQSVNAYCRNRGVRIQEENAESTLADERKRLTRAKAIKVETENDVMLKSLIPLQDVTDTMSAILSALKGELLGLSGRLAEELASEADAAVVKQVISTEVRSALNRVAAKLAGLSQEEQG